jgi:hypothetical protein
MSPVTAPLPPPPQRADRLPFGPPFLIAERFLVVGLLARHILRGCHV